MIHYPGLGASVAAALALALAAAPAAPVQAAAVFRGEVPVRADRPTASTTLAVGRGTLITLPAAMSDVFVADDKVADVQVRSPSQLWVFGRGAGETTLYATTKGGAVLWSSQVRVGVNLDSVTDMLRVAMPDAQVVATPMNGMVLLTGTVATPDDVAEATRLAEEYLGDKTKVLVKLKTATPLQVNLHVKIAEVSRNVSKAIGINLLSRDRSGGFLFGIAQGRNVGTITDTSLAGFPLVDASQLYGLPTGSISLPFNPATGKYISGPGTSYDFKAGDGVNTTLNFAGKLLGLDIAAALDLAETKGLVTTLAEPNLTALSGETASFLAGGEIPLPQSQGLGAVSVEYKQYGVSLAFTPIVLSDGRISLRVRPEVSQLSDAGAVKLNGFSIPALITRRAETTVELGSGQSFMIGGLLQNTHNNATDKAPFLGDLPIIGNLFRSNAFRKSETELVIVVTPYLVKPVDAARLRVPTDGYKAATDAVRVLGNGQSVAPDAGALPPGPTRAPGASSPLPAPAPAGK